MANKTTILALPHAGGAAYQYHCFRRLGDDITFLPVDLPGHGTRMREPLLTTIPLMARDVIARHSMELQGRFLLFGHSMGAILAYEICCQLAEAGAHLPIRLLVSGHQAPTIPETRRLSTLPHDALVDALSALGGMPEELSVRPELFAVFAPSIRADLLAIESYTRTNIGALPVPISVLSGIDDDLSDMALSAWREVTTEYITRHTFPGGHFYLFEQITAVAALLQQAARADTPVLPVSSH